MKIMLPVFILLGIAYLVWRSQQSSIVNVIYPSQDEQGSSDDESSLESGVEVYADESTQQNTGETTVNPTIPQPSTPTTTITPTAATSPTVENSLSLSTSPASVPTNEKSGVGGGKLPGQQYFYNLQNPHVPITNPDAGGGGYTTAQQIIKDAPKVSPLQTYDALMNQYANK